MAGARLFKKDIPPACEYCELGSDSSDGTMVDCKRNGLVSPHFKCIRFRYSPIRRTPRPAVIEQPDAAAEYQIS